MKKELKNKNNEHLVRAEEIATELFNFSQKEQKEIVKYIAELVKKESQKTVLQKLIEENICFSVGVALNTFKIKGVDVGSKDYHFIAHGKDQQQLLDLGFNFKSANEKDYSIINFDLEKEDIRYFKSIQDVFIKVNNDKNGRVFELKSNSFKKYYKKHSKFNKKVLID